MAAKFPHIILRPRTKEELADPQFMLDLALTKMSEVGADGNQMAGAQDRRDLLIALSRQHHREKWVEVIEGFCVVAPMWEQVVNRDGEAKVVTSDTKTAEERTAEILAKAREAKARIKAEKEREKVGEKAGDDANPNPK